MADLGLIHYVALGYGERPMPDEPMIANTEDLANTEYDAERLARFGEEKIVGSNVPMSPKDDRPEVGLSQKGEGEDAVVKHETEIREIPGRGLATTGAGMTKLFIAQVRTADGPMPLVTVRAEAEGEARLFLAAAYPDALIESVDEPSDWTSDADTGTKAGDVREHAGVEWQASSSLAR